MKSYPNESVFPEHPQGQPQFNQHTYGLSKREYFAAMAMQGLCVPCIPGRENGNDKVESNHKAEMAVRLADTLIAELNKEQA